MPRFIPKGCEFWPAQADNLTPDQVVRMYEAGFAGVWHDPDAHEALKASLPEPEGANIAHAYGWADSGADQLVAPLLLAERVFPGCLPGPAQARGDCVSHASRNAALLTLICEIVAGQPDPETGLIEGVPELSAEGIKQGVLSSEAIYWWRRHGGDGWSCDEAAKVLREESGLWLRKDYPELGVDLTRYSGELAGKYGRTTPPQNYLETGRKHLVRQVTFLKSFEEIRDFLKNGYAVFSCGSEGFANVRDENGVSRRKGTWPHALSHWLADDRPIVKQRYGEPLLHTQNSWAIWNSGGKRILGTNYEIADGGFLSPWSDLKNRQFIAVSSINGWPARDLPNWGATGRI